MQFIAHDRETTIVCARCAKPVRQKIIVVNGVALFGAVVYCACTSDRTDFGRPLGPKSDYPADPADEED